MLQRRYLLVLLTLGVLGLSAGGQDQGGKADLSWKFEKGKTFYQEMVTDTDQKLQVMGQDVPQKQKQTFYFSWTPLEQDKDGNWTISQKIDGVKMDIDVGGNKVSYDSTNPGTANNPLADFFKALVGAEFKLKVGKDLKVTSVEGRKEFLDRLGQSNPSMKPLLEQILSEDALKQMSDPSLGMVPNKEVKKGESWKRDSKLNLGPIGTYDTAFEYTFDGVDKDLARIKVKQTLKYSPPAESATANLPFKIRKGDLKSTSPDGTILFNVKLGRLESSESSLTLSGDLEIEVGGMSSKVTLNQTQKTTIRTSGDPILKK